MNSEKGATHATSATHWVKLLIYNTIVCSRYEVSTCYTFFVPATHCCAGARAADRGARCMIRSVFFMGFLRPLFMIHEELGEAGASAE